MRTRSAPTARRWRSSARSPTPTVRALADDEWLVANGTSCRHQIADLAGATGRHVVTVLDIAADLRRQPVDAAVGRLRALRDRFGRLSVAEILTT